MPIALRPFEHVDLPAMAAIRAQEWETETFWAHRIRLYLSGEHSPRQALPARAAFVALDGAELVGVVAGHRTRRLACDGELQWVNVARERRGQGAAGKLIGRIGEWFVEQSRLRQRRPREHCRPHALRTTWRTTAGRALDDLGRFAGDERAGGRVAGSPSRRR
jgi:GNAT superfamily N-acetyltransferase